MKVSPQILEGVGVRSRRSWLAPVGLLRDFYCLLLVEVSLFLSSEPKMELGSEKIESISFEEDPKREVSEGTCQVGIVES